MAQVGKNLLAVWEIWARSLGWEDPLEEGMAPHSSVLAYTVHGILWTDSWQLCRMILFLKTPQSDKLSLPQVYFPKILLTGRKMKEIESRIV